MNKEPFSFEYIRPCLDWYETIPVVINPDDYYYFRIERRFGPSWWLIGSNPKNEPNYHWDETQIGEISGAGLRQFIEWAKTENGSKVTEIKAICGTFNIIEEITKVLK